MSCTVPRGAANGNGWHAKPRDRFGSNPEVRATSISLPLWPQHRTSVRRMYVATLPIPQVAFDVAPHTGGIIVAGLQRYLCRLLRRLESAVETVFLNHLIRDDMWVVGHSVFYFDLQYFGNLIASRAVAFSASAYRPPENRGQSSASIFQLHPGRLRPCRRPWAASTSREQLGWRRWRCHSLRLGAELRPSE